MTIEATPKTAAFAGAWAVLGLVPLEAWSQHHNSLSVLTQNLIFLCGAVIFLLIPGYFLVIGKQRPPISSMWFLNSEERARYAVVVKRMLVWFFSAGVFGTAWSLIFNFIIYSPSVP